MSEFIELIRDRIADFRFSDAVDILLLAGIFFLIYRFIRHRRAFPILIGVVSFLLLSLVAELTPLNGIIYVTSALRTYGVFVLVVIFQPELRALLEKIGDSVVSFLELLKKLLTGNTEPYLNSNATKLKNAILHLSRLGYGALIVLEGNTGTDDVVKKGVKLDALISSELIESIFNTKSPLHDGAIIIRGGRIRTASSYVIVNSTYDPMPAYGARHNAGRAVSISNRDCISIIISEENHSISYARDGKLVYKINERELNTLLNSYFSGKSGRSSKREHGADADLEPIAGVQETQMTDKSDADDGE